MADLNDLVNVFDDILEGFPEERRKLVERAGEKMHRQVLRNIDTDTREKTGHLRKACHMEIGSEGGYAAVRNNNMIAPHAHLVENGHRLIKGARKKKNKYGNESNIKGSGKVIGWVNGKHMYRNAMNELEDELTKDAENTLQKIVGGKF